MLNMPQTIVHSEGIEFLLEVKKCDLNNPFIFRQTLKEIRPDLLSLASRLPWLCSEFGSHVEYIQSLIGLLKAELSNDQIKQIYRVISIEVEGNLSFRFALNTLFEKGFFQRDLYKLSKLMEEIGRDDIPNKMMKFQNIFSLMEEIDFHRIMKEELTR